MAPRDFAAFVAHRDSAGLVALLPLSVPLWILWMEALLAARASLALLGPVGTFLTAPPEPLRSHNYCGHDHREAKPPRRLSLVDRNVA